MPIEVVRGPNELWRENQQPVITVSAELDKRDLGSVNRELQEKLQELKFPPGYRWELAGSHRARRAHPGSRSGAKPKHRTVSSSEAERELERKLF